MADPLHQFHSFFFFLIIASRKRTFQIVSLIVNATIIYSRAINTILLYEIRFTWARIYVHVKKYIRKNTSRRRYHFS